MLYCYCSARIPQVFNLWMNGRPERSPKGKAEEQKAFPKGLHGLKARGSLFMINDRFKKL